MARPFPLQLVAEVNQQRLEEAERALQVATRLLQQAHERLKQLQRFDADYRQSYAAKLAAGLSASQLADYRVFLGKLEQAIAQQRTNVDLAAQSREASRQRWEEQRRMTEAVMALKTRHEKAEAYRDARIEQRQMDEFAARAGNRREFD